MKFGKISILVLLSLVQNLSYGATVPSAPTLLKASEGNVEFSATGKPSMLKIHGESKALTGQFAIQGVDVSGDLQVLLDGFTTGMSVRDNHLKEKIFEVKKFDKATLKITKLTLPNAQAGTYKALDFSGKLNFHGVDKDVTGKVDVTTSTSSLQFDATLEVNLTDFQIAPPEFMGMTIQDKVKIEAKGEAK